MQNTRPRNDEREREQLRNRVCANAKHQADADAFKRNGAPQWDNRAAALHARLYWSDLATLGFVGALYAAEHLARSLANLGLNPDLGFVGNDPRSYASQRRTHTYRPQRMARA